MRITHFAPALIALTLVPTGPARAEPSAETILEKADAILAPEGYEAEITYVTHKSKGRTRTFSMKLWKKDADKFRVKFSSPADDRNMEVLRVGDNMWQYVPNLKRAIRISPKQEFHGGDFSNADMLRVNLAADYTAALDEADSDSEWLLELTAKTDEVAYHRVMYWIRKSDFMPLRQEFYTKSGKLVRKLELSDPKKFGKLVRPSRYVMRNMLVPARWTELEWTGFALKDYADNALFQQSRLGR